MSNKTKYENVTLEWESFLTGNLCLCWCPVEGHSENCGCKDVPELDFSPPILTLNFEDGRMLKFTLDTSKVLEYREAKSTDEPDL